MENGLQALGGYVQQVLGLLVSDAPADVEPDFRGIGCRGYAVVHGKRSAGGLEPYHVNTTRNLTWKERAFLYALRARDDVAEESPLDVGISRAAGQKLMHSCSLVVEDASADPVWIHTSARSMQVPAMRWVNAAAAIIIEKVQYGPMDSSLWTGRTLADAEIYVPRGHLRFKQHGLSAWTLQRHCRNEIQPPLAEVLRKAPLYVAAATAGLTCRAGVVAHPDGFEIILTDCENLTREILVPFHPPPAPTTFGSFSHSRSHRNLEEPPENALKTALVDALAQWIQEADAKEVASWDLLWVTPASASYLLACFEPALRWPPHCDSIMVAAKGEICLLPEAFSAALREAMKEVSRDMCPPRAETGLFEMVDDEGDESAELGELGSLHYQGASKGRRAIAQPDEAPVRAATVGLNAFEAPMELDLGLMDIAKQKRYIARVQDALAAELAMAMGVQPEDVIVSSIEEDENGGWKAIFSANATRDEMESAMAGTQNDFPPPGPDQRVRRLAADIRSEKLSKNRRFSMLNHVNPKIPMHEIERVQITDTLAWCHGLGGFTEEDTRRLASIFLSPEALHRKAYSGKGLQAQDFKRLRAAGFTDTDLRRLGLLGYGLSDDEVVRLEAAGFNKEVLQRRLLSGDAFTQHEQTRLRTEGLPVERLRKLLAGSGKFSMSEKERLMRAGLSEMEVRRRLIGGEDFDEEEVERLDQVELPLYELRRRILQDEIFSTEERLRLGVVGLDEASIQQRLEDREPFTADELFSLESAGFDPEELHRRLHGESCFSPSELQTLALIGMSEEDIVRRLLAGEEFSDEELKWLQKGGLTLAKLIRRVFGTSNPTKEDGDLSRSFWLGPEDEMPERLTNQNMAMALQRLMSDIGLLSDEEHYMLESCGLSMEEMQRRLALGDGFTEEELERLESAGLSASLQRLASTETISDSERQVLESCGLPVEEIHRRIMTGEDFTEDEVNRLQAAGFRSIEDLQSAVLADSEQKEEAKQNEGEVIFKKSLKLKQKAANMPFASEIAMLLKSRYVSEEKLATTTMQSQALERLVIAARNAADDLTDVALADLAKAIAEAIHAETAEQEIEEAQELLHMLRAQYLMQLLETAVESEDMTELHAMLQAVEGKVKTFGLGPPPGADEQTGMLLGFYPRELDPRLPLQGLIQRARAKQEKAMAEMKLEDAMQHVAQCPLDNIIQIQQCINMLQDAMQKGEETGANPVLMFAVEELLTDLRGRKARHDEFHSERIAAWHHLQQSCIQLHNSASAALKERKALQAAFQERSPKVPSGYKEELPVPSCSVSKSLQVSLGHFLELGLNSTDDIQAETENLLELLISVAGLKDFFQLPPPTDVFQLNDRQVDLASIYPNFKEFADVASPPIGPIPGLLKDCVRDFQKLLDTWAKLVAEAMPRGLLQAILSGSSDLVAACLYVCVDKPAVFAQVRDERTGAGAVHVAAAEGHTTIIKVLVENGADVHEVSLNGQSALDVAIETLQKQAIDVDLQLAGRLQETVDLLHNEYKVISYDYVKYKKHGAWFKRPETMLKWLRIKQLLEHHFENLKKAFLEIDTNHSGGIVKYEWEAMFGAEGQVKDALAAADLESNDVFGMLDGLDMEGKDMVITKSAFELLDLLDWHLTSDIWQDILLKPLFVRSRRGAVRHQLPPPPKLEELVAHKLQ